MELQAMYSAILQRGRRSVPTYSEVRRDARAVTQNHSRILY
jgi:hypothetical protein